MQFYHDRGSFPNACKTAKVKPLFEKGSKTDPIKLHTNISTTFIV